MASRRVRRPATRQFDPDRPYQGHYHYVVEGDVARAVGYCEDGPFRCEESYKHAWGTLGVSHRELVYWTLERDYDEFLAWLGERQREYDNRERRR